MVNDSKKQNITNLLLFFFFRSLHICMISMLLYFNHARICLHYTRSPLLSLDLLRLAFSFIMNGFGFRNRNFVNKLFFWSGIASSVCVQCTLRCAYSLIHVHKHFNYKTNNKITGK